MVPPHHAAFSADLVDDDLALPTDPGPVPLERLAPPLGRERPRPPLRVPPVELPVHPGRLGPRAGPEPRDVEHVRLDLLHEPQGVGELLLGLAREAADHVGGEAQPREGLPEPLHDPPEALDCVPPPHPPKQLVVPRLDGEVQEPEHLLGAVGLDEVLQYRLGLVGVHHPHPDVEPPLELGELLQ